MMTYEKLLRGVCQKQTFRGYYASRDRTLLQLASLVQQGLEIKCSEAFEE